jgi:uncharacterized membrane protein
MTSLIVASFANEAEAVRGSHKLQELESFGDISVFEKVMVKKDSDGEITFLQDDTSNGLRTVGGLAIGTLIGAIAGPVGAAVGMMVGTMTGAVVDVDRMDFADDFGSKVTERLQPGTTAIIAEISEDGPAFVDSSLEPLGATIFRINADDAYDYYEDEQVDEFDESIADERARLHVATASEKTKIQQKISQLKEKRKARVAELKEKHNSSVENRKTNRKENKEARIQDRINRHQERIAVLEGKLKDLELNA